MSRKTSCIVVGAALAVLLWGGAFAQTGASQLLGEPIGAGLPVDRVITIDANTRWANVMQNETIKFVAGGKDFSWRFASPKFVVNLKDIAPAGTIDRNINVYLTPDPLFVPDL